MHTGAWSLIAKLCAAGNLFISIPFVLHSLGPEQFGAWATLVSLIVFAGFLDFGFGNGTMNLVAAAYGRNSITEVAVIVRESRKALLLIAGLLAIIALVALPLVSWQRVLGMPESMSGMCRAAVAAVLFSVILAVPMNLANRIQLGLGHGDRAFRWQAVGQVATLIVVVALAKAQSSLATLTVAAVATPLLASVANTCSLLRNPLLKATTSTSSVDHVSIRHRIWRDGAMFFLLQLAASLAFSADLPLVSNLRGPYDAGTYAIVQRLYSAIPLVLSLVWAPLWPIYRQALSANQHEWVKRTLRNSMILAIVFAAVSATLLTFGFETISGFWLERPLVVSGTLLAGCGVWCVIEAGGTALATFLNAAGVIRYQSIVAIAFASVCICAKIWAIQEFGIISIPWITIIIYSFVNVLPFYWFGPRIFKGIFENSESNRADDHDLGEV